MKWARVLPEQRGGDFGGPVRRMCQLYSAGFAASAGMNLRFDDDYIGLEAVRTFAGFFLGKGDFATRGGDAVACEDSFSLVFVNLHQ